MKTTDNVVNYFDLNIHQRINAKGNAGLLYTSYNQKWANAYHATFTLLMRISKRDPDLFTPNMLLNKNTISI